MRILMKVLKKVPKDFSQVLLFDIVSKLLTGISAIFLIRILTIDAYAQYVKFNAISSLILSILSMGITTAFVRGATEQISRGNESHIYKLYRDCNKIILAIMALSMLGLPALMKLYHTGMPVIISAIIYGILLALNKMNQAFFQASEKFAKSGLIDNIKNIFLAACLICVYVIAQELSIDKVIIIYLLCPFIAYLIGTGAVKKETVKFPYSEVGTGFRSIVRQSVWLILYGIILNLIDQSDIIMINAYLDDQAVASYGVALKYYSLLLTLQGTLGTVVGIRTSKKEIIDDSSERKNFSVNWIKKTWKLVFLGCFCLMLISEKLMLILNGAGYPQSVLAFKIFIIGVGISYIFTPNVWIMMAAAKHKVLCFLCFGGLLINVGINYFFLPAYGIAAASLATVIGNAFLNIGCALLITSEKQKQ